MRINNNSFHGKLLLRQARPFPEPNHFFSEFICSRKIFKHRGTFVPSVLDGLVVL
jgi:hypothetical protein